MTVPYADCTICLRVHSLATLYPACDAMLLLYVNILLFPALAPASAPRFATLADIYISVTLHTARYSVQSRCPPICLVARRHSFPPPPCMMLPYLVSTSSLVTPSNTK